MIIFADDPAVNFQLRNQLNRDNHPKLRLHGFARAQHPSRSTYSVNFKPYAMSIQKSAAINSLNRQSSLSAQKGCLKTEFHKKTLSQSAMPLTPSSAKNIVEKSFQCQICRKTFTTPFSLRRHVRIHTGERPYRCHVCDKRYISAKQLKTHSIEHSAVKPHQCQHCSKGFAFASELKTHLRSHDKWNSSNC